ncbi:hypothetical protein F5050DRAFT_596855 [Lentinula boryana]|uniref:BBC1/AIM3 cysteine proteinase-fold domain-containing protein n=1 Tax=Lentinula boryana TaxID=40481 RepID=A0ABQ8QNM7_9AGAR|nr:hypothetical protein F5050DRAFT_596855 [Lentinula boryana]
MSDQTPPPKPKPGSLRDRIAAFEKPTQSNGPPPVAPRPKPGGHVAWKPKPATPPDSPAADESPGNQPKKSGGGMSASDAKESIGKGGSLKERMAALQGKGAFGAPPPIAPKPATEKPKWKPPPPVASPPDEERETTTDKAEEASPSSTTAKLPGDESNKALGDSDSSHPEAQPQIEGEGEAKEQVDVDQEEEERQRRTALAARMARLGGARVGMGPPVFGGPAYKKPQPKPEPRSDTPLKEDVSELVKSDTTEPTSKEPSLKSPPAPDTEDKSDEGTKKEYFDVERKASDASSLLSPDPTASASNSPRTPSSMPVPAAPRRAAPPRRKAGKSPAPQLPTEPEQETSNIDPSIDSTGKETEVHSPSVTDPKALGTVVSIGPLVDDAPLESQEAEEPSMIVAVEETPIPTTKTELEEPEVIETVSAASGSLTEEPEPITTTHVETEEDEASRRQRVAERLAKSGGVNPFALPPQRKPSSPIVSSEDSLPLTSAPVSPASQKRTSIRKASTDSVSNSFSAPPARRGSQMSVSSVSPPTKKPNTDSVSSHDIIPHDDDINAARIFEEPESSLVEEADITDEELAEEELPPEEYEEYAEDNPATDFQEIARAPAVLPITDIKPLVTVPPPKAAPTVDELGKFPHPSMVGSENEPEDEHYTPPAPPRRTMPPPPRLVPEHEEEVKHSLPQHTESPRRLPPRQVLEDDGEMSDAPLPHPNRLSVPSTPPESDDAAEENHISDDEPKPIPASRPIQLFPLSEHSATEETVVPEGKLDSNEIESPEEILPTPPRRPFQEQPPVQEEPLFIPPPPPPKAPTTAPRRASTQVGKVELPPHTVEQQSVVSTPALSVSNVDTRRAEILDEEEGDPIDPSFHSPPSRRTSALPVALHTTKSEPEPEQAPVEDEEQARRRTIAERMAKLGGLKLGAAPISMSRPAPAKRRESQEGSHQIEAGSEETVEDEPELTEEEEEKARKERIAAKMASMGGMRIGMQPYGMFAGKAPLTPSRPVAASPENDNLHAHPPPRHAAPPPPPPPQDIDSEHESLSTSDEGVKVEAEESEMEEVNYEDAEEEQDEIPPPIPTREGRHSVPHPTGRPPVPTALPSRKASIQSTTSQKSNDTASLPIPRKSSVSQTLPPSTEYVMVEGEEEEELAPPPPPPRVGRPAPPRAAPLPPPSTSPVPASESISSHWEMPSIPSVDFGGHADLSLSWTDDMASSTSSAPPSAEPSATRSTREPVQTTAPNLSLSSDDLVAIWGRVGVQVCEVATTLFEKSKKALIGDGTYYGFIDATLKEVPNAAPISEQDIGYLIYMQSGASVQKRAGEILPGDIVWMHDAKFKGHKGLQNYSQIVGSAGPLVGVVSEFEAKKFKIRVLQANQHVGQQTVEAVSYRLEDLKSGQVKIFRVLEA